MFILFSMGSSPNLPVSAQPSPPPPPSSMTRHVASPHLLSGGTSHAQKKSPQPLALSSTTPVGQSSGSRQLAENLSVFEGLCSQLIGQPAKRGTQAEPIGDKDLATEHSSSSPAARSTALTAQVIFTGFQLDSIPVSLFSSLINKRLFLYRYQYQYLPYNLQRSVFLCVGMGLDIRSVAHHFFGYILIMNLVFQS